MNFASDSVVRLSRLLPLLVLALAPCAGGAELRRGPYLQVQRPDGISIRWRTDASVHYTSVLRYGKDHDNLDRVVAAKEVEIHYPGVRDWQVTLDELEPDTTYYYAVEADRATLCGADPRHCFRTAPPKGVARKMRFLLLGDFGANRPRNDDLVSVLAATKPMDAVLVRNGFRKFNAGKSLDGIILLGDNAYPNGTDEMYQAALFNLYADELQCTPLWPCTGNHDLDDAYPHLFTVNGEGKAGGVPSKSKLYYSVDLGNLHLTVIDPWISWWQETTDLDHPRWQRQLEWLKKDLKASRQEWMLAVNHFPPYCDGNYQGDGDPLCLLSEHLVPVLEENGVDMLVAGHDHTYQRSYLIKGLTGPAATYDPERHRVSDNDGRKSPIVKSPGPDSGTMYIVAGTGGGCRPDGKFAHPAMIPFRTAGGERRGLAVPGSLVLEVDGLTLRGWDVGIDGEVLDQFAIEHDKPRAGAAEK